MLGQHSSWEPIGVGIEMKEDATGLLVKAALNLDTIRGREAYSLLKQGALKLQ
ncbi:MAG: HK97 family phage prohead protease [Nitrospirae bacterium]|nr:HK97 family phage prohead protease [Nitrospirota bacterium]